ncbi:MAG: hypothetical protein ACKO5K_09560, partial [Armatimonadota bacterium]
GSVRTPRNVVRSPGDSGSYVRLHDLTGTGPFRGIVRTQVSWPISEDREVRLLHAPLTVDGTGTAPADFQFAGQGFVGGAPVDARYTFNSYRATVRRRIVKDERTTAWAGITLKIRDAGIVLRQGGTLGRDTNVGVVPLVHAAGTTRIGKQWHLVGDIDGLAAPMGRAIDFGLRLQYALPDGTRIGTGLRTLEGGADNRRVFTFAWLNYTLLSVTRTF